MSVILFYMVLIGGIVAAFAAYAAALIVPVSLMFRQLGPIAGVLFAAVLAAVLYLLFEPPFGGSTLTFAPAAMRPNLYLVGLTQEPPLRMIVASLAVSAAGLLIVLFAWLRRRAARYP